MPPGPSHREQHPPTDPDVLRALIELVKEAGASRILVMDHCSIEPGTAQVLKANLPGNVVEETGVIKAAVDADVRISMGVAKSHSVTRMTLALTHMKGFLESPSGLHTNIHKGIADLNINSQIKADLHILEALYIRMAFGDYVTCAGSETAEKNPAIVKSMNQIIAGVDPVLVD